MTRPPRQLGVAFIVLAMLVTDTSAASDWRAYEIGMAMREAGRVRYLAERLSKLNILYQMDIGNVAKRDMHFPVNEIDRILGQLSRGSTFYSIAGPVNQAAVDRLARIEEVWIPVRKLALASPYDYLRRARDYLPPENPRGDPLAVRKFDEMTQRFIAEVDKLADLYLESCRGATYRLCDLSRTSGDESRFAERIVKDLVFVHEGLDARKRRKMLAESIERFDTNWAKFDGSQLLVAATDPARGEDGQFVAKLKSRIDENWTTIRDEARLAVDGRSHEVDLLPILEIQRGFVHDFDRLTAVMSRFVAGGFASEATAAARSPK